MVHHLHSTPKPPSRVIVLGASGFVGSDLVEELARNKVPTMALSSRDVNLLDADCPAKLEKITKPGDVLVLVSALTPDRGKDVGTFMRNLKMAEHVAGFLETGKVSHFVYIGSDAVYADHVAQVREDTPAHPGSFHGMMHLARELMLTQAAKKAKTPCLLLRPTVIYGPKDTHNSYGPNRFFRTAVKEHKIVLFGNGEEKRDHVFIHDLTEIIMLGMQYRSEGVLNVASGGSASFFDVAHAIAELLPFKVTVECTPRGNPITHRHFDITELAKAWPFFEHTPLHEGLAHYARAVAAKTAA